MDRARPVPRRLFLALSASAILLAGVALALEAAEPAVVRLWNWNIHDKKYQQKMYKLFNQRHPDIKLEFSSISNTVYDQTLEAAFIAKEPPDLFLPSGKLTFNRLRTEGMIMPLNDVAPSADELSAWMAQFPAQLRKFVEGRSIFQGKVYIVDTAGESFGGVTLYYNKTLFSAAGLAQPPATQSQLRQYAAKLTKAGDGRSFGIVHGLRYRPGAWHQDMASSLGSAAGVRGTGGPAGGHDQKDGKFHAGSPEFITAMKTWIGMREDGSVFPGELTIEDEQAKMAFSTNKAAMFFGGPWVVSNVLAYNPDADFDHVLPPTPDDGVRRGYNWVSQFRAPFGYVVASTTKNPKAVWEVIKFISSLEYQEGYVQGGYGISYLPAANKRQNFQIPQMYRFVEWYMDPSFTRIMPNPKNEGALVVYDYFPGIYPTYEDVMDNVYLGKAGFDALVDMDNRCNAALDVAIAKAQEAGVKVTREDLYFPDWDPSKDYVPKKQ